MAKLAKTVTENAKVRFDTNAGKWAIVSKDGVRHFEFGIMENVKFTKEVVSKQESWGCGTKTVDQSVGFAHGRLTENVTGRWTIGFHNIQFTDQGFAGADHVALESCKVLKLTANRKALYK